MTSPLMLAPKPRLVQQPWGPEKLCPRCDEYWPADGEFFSPRAEGKLDSWCRCCVNEYHQERRRRVQ